MQTLVAGEVGEDSRFRLVFRNYASGHAVRRVTEHGLRTGGIHVLVLLARRAAQSVYPDPLP